MIMRLQFDNCDLVQMANTTNPEHVTTGDIFQYCHSINISMQMMHTIYYENGPRRYYWKNYATGRTGWDS